MGNLLSQVVGKLLGGGPVCESQCKNVHCCTSTRASWTLGGPARRTGHGKSRTARPRRSQRDGVSSDSKERDVHDDLRRQLEKASCWRRLLFRIRHRGDHPPANRAPSSPSSSFRVADAFLSTDRGQYLYWIDEALQTLNWAALPIGAYTGTRLAAWISSNYASRQLRGSDQ